MKRNILSLVALALFALSSSAAAQISPTISVQGTNATVRWASIPGESYVVLYRRAFHPGTNWIAIGTNVVASAGAETTFQHTGGVPRVPAGYTGGGGGGSSSPPQVQSAVVSGTPTDSKGKDDKVKKQDGGLPGFPALPDEKEIEKWLKQMLKDYEKNQSQGGGLQVFSAMLTSSLTLEQATSNSMGFYVVVPVTADTDLDGLPNWWETLHGLSLLSDDAQGDSDGDGVPNLAEYAYGTNPRDPASKPVVHITYTSPVNTATYFPVVQISGSINLNVRSLLVDVTNAAGVATGLEGFVTQRTVVPGPGFTNAPAKYTNSFQCFDVPLTNGANTVGLRFTDAYGLTFATTVSFTVAFSASPAAPVGTILWPASGTALGADTFTLRGRLDNATASVVARMTIEGEEQEVGGLVERDGTFWLEDLPVAGPVTLVFTDAGGKSRTNTLNYTRSPVTLTLYEPSGPNLWDQTMNVSGAVSDPAYSVWVNSVRATVDENGNWSAENVPVNAGGVASFALRAVPNTDNGGAGTGGQAMAGGGGLGGLYNVPTGNPGSASAVDATFDFDKPPRIVVSSYTMRSQDDNPLSNHPDYGTGHTNRQTLDWTRSGAGYSGFATDYWQNDDPSPQTNPYYYSTRNTTWPYPGTSGVELFSGLYLNQDFYSSTNAVGPPGIPWEQVSISSRSGDQVLNRNAKTHLLMETGGKTDPDVLEVWEISGSATYREPLTYTWLAEEPSNLQLFGRNLDISSLLDLTNRLQNTQVDATPVLLAAAYRTPWYQEFYWTVGQTRYAVELAGKLQPGWARRLSQASQLMSGNRPFVLGYDQFVVYARAAAHANGPERIIYRLGSANNTVTNIFMAGTNWIPWDGRRFQPPPNHVGYVNPNVPNAVQVTVATSRTNVASPAHPIKVIAGAFAGADNEAGFFGGTAANVDSVKASLTGMGYTVTTDYNLLSVPAIQQNVQKKLIWYSLTHGFFAGAGANPPYSQGDFLGLDLRENGTNVVTITPASLTATNLNYELVFLNGCRSANGPMAAEFQSKMSAKIYVGWSASGNATTMKTVGQAFFAALAQGATSVGGAKDAAVLAVSASDRPFVRDHLVIAPDTATNTVINLTIP